jgi:adenylyltransferase/sulfurtransferase
MKELSVKELKAKLDSGENIQLIDVREQHEVEICSFDNAIHIPMGEIINRRNEIDQNKTVVIHCRSGARSASVINALEQNFGFKEMYNLKGGIIAWANEIDLNMATY